MAGSALIGMRALSPAAEGSEGVISVTFHSQAASLQKQNTKEGLKFSSLLFRGGGHHLSTQP